MTEAEWLACDDPKLMLDFLKGKTSDRKLRLFAVAAIRPDWHLLIDVRSRTAVEIAEQAADEIVLSEKLAEAYKEAWDAVEAEAVTEGPFVSAARAAGRTVQNSAFEAGRLTTTEVVEMRAELAEGASAPEVEKARLYWQGKSETERRLAQLVREIFGNPIHPVRINPVWRTATAIHLAQWIYNERSSQQMPELADALEEAGCTNKEILGHCRVPGPHVRGCWVLDLILGKE